MCVRHHGNRSTAGGTGAHQHLNSLVCQPLGSHLAKGVDHGTRHALRHPIDGIAQALRIKHHGLEGVTELAAEVLDDGAGQLVEVGQVLFGGGQPLLPVSGVRLEQLLVGLLLQAQ
ncbi:hypothetical protein D3C84_818680 [compost metagenome]